MVPHYLHIKYLRAGGLSLLLILAFSHSALSAPEREGALYKRIISFNQKGNGGEVKKNGRQFLRLYPRSSRVADVRFYMAEHETNTARALEKYKRIIRYYRHFRKRDYVYYRICQINLLRSDWKKVSSASAAALSQYPKSPLRSDFLLISATASLKEGRLDDARRQCRLIQARDHRYSYMARSLLLLASIEKRKTGFSRAYVYALREILLGFRESKIYPSALYMTGEFYLHHGDKNRAFTAFTDLTSKYPDAPESIDARNHLRELKKSNPSRQSYFPNEKVIKGTDSLDISPEQNISDRSTGPCYSLAVGPFSTQEAGSRIYRLIKGYGKIKSFRTRRGFTHYIGCSSRMNTALQLKVRLAEELGINGNIARINRSKGRSFIYGEDQ